MQLFSWVIEINATVSIKASPIPQGRSPPAGHKVLALIDPSQRSVAAPFSRAPSSPACLPGLKEGPPRIPFHSGRELPQYQHRGMMPARRRIAKHVGPLELGGRASGYIK